jgi:hypothetical protein
VVAASWRESIRCTAHSPHQTTGSQAHIRCWHSTGLAGNPAIRASAVRDTLAFLDTFEPSSLRRVMERVPAASREIIEGTPGSSWISIEHDHWAVDAIIEEFGTERAIECWRDSVPALVDRPLLRNFVYGMISVLGRSPISVVRLFTKGWPLVYQDLCEPKVIACADGQPTIRFENIAPEVRRYPNYLHSWHGACQGFAHVARVKGDVRFEVSPDFSWAEAKFFWHEDAVARAG